jgi:hypothetical protein
LLIENEKYTSTGELNTRTRYYPSLTGMLKEKEKMAMFPLEIVQRKTDILEFLAKCMSRAFPFQIMTSIKLALECSDLGRCQFLKSDRDLVQLYFPMSVFDDGLFFDGLLPLNPCGKALLKLSINILL